jgi:UDP-N-acetylmuramoylalanine--D-glutamate ligase
VTELSGRKVLVLGLGVSGRSAARFCAERGAAVVAADEREPAAFGDLSELEECVELALGRPFPDPAEFDLVVPSPGVPRERYAERARDVMGDVEIAYRNLSVPVVAVTGTNGKSTTCRLLEAMLCASDLRARAAGNLGVPALSLVGAPLDVAVLEVSSFQLETTSRFRPHVAVVLNLSEDHVDRHGSFQAYAEAKARILAHQTGDDHAVLPADDPVACTWAARTRAHCRFFSSQGPVEDGAWWDSGAIVLRRGDAVERLAVEGFALPGRHNRENALAALLAALAAGAAPARAARALDGFVGLPHRAEVVGHAHGVTWVNDSKATNVGAALRALQGFGEHVVWLGGGRDKGADLGRLRDAAPRMRAALVFGEAAARLEELLGDLTDVRRVGDLATAIEVAREIAAPGDVVLLAPACSSLDQFESFEARGDHFRAAVAGFAGGGGSA